MVEYIYISSVAVLILALAWLEGSGVNGWKKQWKKAVIYDLILPVPVFMATVVLIRTGSMFLIGIVTASAAFVLYKTTELLKINIDWRSQKMARLHCCLLLAIGGLLGLGVMVVIE